MQATVCFSLLLALAVTFLDFSFASVLSPKVSLSEQASKHGLGPPEGAETTTETETTTGSTTSEADDETTQNFAGLFTTSSMPPSASGPWMDYLPRLATNMTNGTCIDSNNTGIKLRSGLPAECKHLANYCEHPTVGVRVKAACVRTCGGCDLSIVKSVFTRCEDQPAAEYPILTLAGEAANCSSLAYFCSGYNNSEYVVQKCPMTCTYCGHPPPPSTTRWQFSTSFVDTVASGVGCSRRRRFGFCYSRRRRMS
mmetsp:Transcript_63121/g.133250  ORF Transcript_63121/g.133250 Transcript_63121/m.133250 type:complete len:254 (-) Transcript_63121:91-852(-)